MNKRLLLTATLLTTLGNSPCVLSQPTAPGSNNGPLSTNAFDGVIDVLAVSWVDGSNANAIDLDTLGGQVIVEANNINPEAINTTGIDPAITVNITGQNSNLTIGAGSIVSGASSGANSNVVYVDAPGVLIDNSGTIRAERNSSIYLTPNASNGFAGTRIVNQATGVIEDTILTGPSVVHVAAGGSGPGLQLINFGTMQYFSQVAGPFASTIAIDSPFDFIENKAGGTITNTSTLPRAVIAVGALASTGDIRNEVGGTISSTSQEAAILHNATTTTGTIFNAGTISSTQASTIKLNGNMTTNSPGVFSLENTGTLRGDFPGAGLAVVELGAGAILAGGIANRGTITDFLEPGGTFALNLEPGTATFYQQAGNVKGDVRLASGGDKVLVMEGGTMTGDVTSTGVVPHTLQLIGGSITGTTTLSDFGDTVNLSGTTLQTLQGGAGPDIINVTGGSFVALDGGGGADVLNIDTTYTSQGTINNIPNINVNNTGTTFTPNQPITMMTGTFTVNPNTTLQFDLTMPAIGSGTIQNNGTTNINASIDITTSGIFNNTNTLTLQSTSTLNVDSYTQTAPGETVFTLQTPGINAVINTVGAATLDPNSTVRPLLALSAYIPTGSTFDIVDAGGVLTDNSTLVQPNSALLSFTKSSVACAGTCVRLTATQKPFTSLPHSQITEGISRSLDQFIDGGALNPSLNQLLAQFQQLPSTEAIENALQSLVPPFNYGLVAGSFVGMSHVFSGIHDRLYNLHLMFNRKYRVEDGMNRGDPAGSTGAWIKPFGAHLKQTQIEGIDGYSASASGLAGGIDWGMNDCNTIGIAGSFTKVNVNDHNLNPKDQSIKSWQGTLYGWFDLFNASFIDFMAGIAQNNYHLNRTISVNQIHSGAIAHVDGIQYGFQSDLGWFALNRSSAYFAPLIRVRYLQLDLDDYSEVGATNIGLNVENNHVSAFETGLGFRTGLARDCANDIQWVSAFSAVISYDFSNDEEESVANFLGTPVVFTTNGISPHPALFDLGFEITRNANQTSSLSLQYDIRLRERFVQQSVYLQYYYLW